MQCICSPKLRPGLHTHAHTCEAQQRVVLDHDSFSQGNSKPLETNRRINLWRGEVTAPTEREHSSSSLSGDLIRALLPWQLYGKHGSPEVPLIADNVMGGEKQREWGVGSSLWPSQLPRARRTHPMWSIAEVGGGGGNVGGPGVRFRP
ncbi:hypothetical protein AAFF_G00176400 [Aldrovandia affinis]|uniref:Uncharacterized protein n=1 Tax=Aldrovandia affinis TaxID=143900 RepID=A0AAD7RL51_9TELE|nr:hypothetical protein AAFF_G00176400 [Aldrovandia affinis]